MNHTISIRDGGVNSCCSCALVNSGGTNGEGVQPIKLSDKQVRDLSGQLPFWLSSNIRH